MTGFVLYAHCSVIYSGRAKSTLHPGNYLIIHKPCGAIMVHGSSLPKPLNYQRSRSRLTITANNLPDNVKLLLTSINKTESLTITIYRIISVQSLENWTDTIINLTFSERELVNKLFDNLYEYCPDINCIVFADMEVPTPYGTIDLLIIDSTNTYHIIEVKRTRAGLSACSQVSRYGKWFKHKYILEYIAAPALSSTAQKYMKEHSITFIDLDFTR